VQTAATIDARAERTVSDAATGLCIIVFCSQKSGRFTSAGATDPVPMAGMSQMAQLVYQLYTHNVESMRTMYEQHMSEHVRAADEEKRERDELIEAAAQQVRVFVLTVFFEMISRVLFTATSNLYGRWRRCGRAGAD